MRGDEAIQAVTYFIDDAYWLELAEYVSFTELEQASCVHLSANILLPYPESSIFKMNMYNLEEQALR